ncbi:MAG: class I SAM-dependent methyltransferase [Parcubacteria group bacterium]|nr:class I SAM-dependent methyltransferase [Parcubacteria group bacterium]
MQNLSILKTTASKNYELLDSGDGHKLERYGSVVVARPDPQALWRKNLSVDIWKKADAIFETSKEKTKWNKKDNIPEKWNIELGGLKLRVGLSAFKHTGIFPEQVPNWQWIGDTISKSNRKISVLNLFGYTGGATLASAKAGAEVCHVDGSKSALAWARDNAELSGLSDKPIRWILDDARTFVLREIKRGKKYDGIIMDPPSFGHGAKKELWKIEEDFLPLLESCKKIISTEPLFFLINGYASGYSPVAYSNNLKAMFEDKKGEIETGELTIEESKTGRLLPAGIFARWKSLR